MSESPQSEPISRQQFRVRDSLTIFPYLEECDRLVVSKRGPLSSELAGRGAYRKLLRLVRYAHGDDYPFPQIETCQQALLTMINPVNG